MSGKSKGPEKAKDVDCLIKLEKDVKKSSRPTKNKYSIKIEFPNIESAPEIIHNTGNTFAPRRSRRGSNDHLVSCVPSPGDIRRMFGCGTINCQPEYAQPGMASDPGQWGAEERTVAHRTASGSPTIRIIYPSGFSNYNLDGMIMINTWAEGSDAVEIRTSIHFAEGIMSSSKWDQIKRVHKGTMDFTRVKSYQKQIEGGAADDADSHHRVMLKICPTDKFSCGFERDDQLNVMESQTYQKSGSTLSGERIVLNIKKDVLLKRGRRSGVNEKTKLVKKGPTSWEALQKQDSCLWDKKRRDASQESWNKLFERYMLTEGIAGDLAHRILQHMTPIEWNKIRFIDDALRVLGEIDTSTLCLIVENIISRTLGQDYVRDTLSLIDFDTAKAAVRLCEVLLSFYRRSNSCIDIARRKGEEMNRSMNESRTSKSLCPRRDRRQLTGNEFLGVPKYVNMNNALIRSEQVNLSVGKINKTFPHISQTSKKIGIDEELRKKEINFNLDKNDLLIIENRDNSIQSAVNILRRLKVFMKISEWNKIKNISDFLNSNGSIDVNIIRNSIFFIIGNTIGEESLDETLLAIDPDKTKAVIALAKVFLDYYEKYYKQEQGMNRIPAVKSKTSCPRTKSQVGSAKRQRESFPDILKTYRSISRVSSRNSKERSLEKSGAGRPSSWGNQREVFDGTARNHANRILKLLLTEYGSTMGELPAFYRCCACQEFKAPMARRRNQLHLWEAGARKLPRPVIGIVPGSLASRLLTLRSAILCRANRPELPNLFPVFSQLMCRAGPIRQPGARCSNTSNYFEKDTVRALESKPRQRNHQTKFMFGHKSLDSFSGNGRVKSATVSKSIPTSLKMSSASSSESAYTLKRSVEPIKSSSLTIEPIGQLPITNQSLRLKAADSQPHLSTSVNRLPVSDEQTNYLTVTEKSVVGHSKLVELKVTSLCPPPFESEPNSSSVVKLGSPLFPISIAACGHLPFPKSDGVIKSHLRVIPVCSASRSVTSSDPTYSEDTLTNGTVSDKTGTSKKIGNIPNKIRKQCPEMSDLKTCFHHDDQWRSYRSNKVTLNQNPLVKTEYFKIGSYKPTIKMGSVDQNVRSSVKFFEALATDQNSRKGLQGRLKVKSNNREWNSSNNTPDFNSKKDTDRQVLNEGNQVSINDETRRIRRVLNWNTCKLVTLLLGSVITLLAGSLAWYYYMKLQ